MLQTSFEDCVFSTQNARSAVDCPHIYSQWLAPGKALVPAQQWPPPKRKQFGGFQDETSFMHSTHFFLSIVTAVFGKNLSYSLTLNSVSSPSLYSYATMWRWITEITCKHVVFWISAFQTVARWVKVKTFLISKLLNNANIYLFISQCKLGRQAKKNGIEPPNHFLFCYTSLISW